MINQMIARTALLLLLFPAVSAGAAEPLRGRAHVLDGDTIIVAGRHIRLSGIDAAELHQGKAGQAARTSLTRQIGGQSVVCADGGQDIYGRTIGRCRVKDVDLSLFMVTSGQAFAYWPFRDADLKRLPCPPTGGAECRRTDADLLAAEDKARIARRGLWAHKTRLLYPACFRRPERCEAK